MTKVIGEFTATVPGPIVVAPVMLNLMNQHRSPSVKLHIRGADVLVQPEEQTEAIWDEQGFADSLPRISAFKVWITRDVSLNSDLDGRIILSQEDEREFEDVLVEALQRIMSAIKSKTGQSSIDTRHPVHSYGYSYSSDDQPVATQFPVGEGFHRMPAYARGTIAFPSLSRELDAEMWESLQTEVASPVEIPLYDELLHDAVSYKADMNYQMAALSAATSMELLLAKICAALLARDGNLQDSQIQELLKGRRPMDLVGIIIAVDPDTPISHKAIQTVTEERNRIAHGKSRYKSAETMTAMIATARMVRGVLSSLEDAATDDKNRDVP